jgi:TolB-like protein/DNA-binding winged helix-turn-helix (wHTH) protein/Tfp pilus assembly protein PilF
MELLLLLVERQGELVSREEIAERLWGRNVFLEVDHSINTAVGKVRQVLRDDPEKPRFVETVVGKGYRFAAPVICSNGGSNRQVQVESARTTAQATSEPADQPAESRFVVRRWRMVVGATAVLALIAAIAFWYRAGSLKPAAQPTIKSLAVLPLKNLSGDPAQEYLADGMTEELIGRLTGIHDLRVISRTSSMQFKDSKLSVPEIAKALNVDAVVEGSVMREGDRIRVHAQLIRGATDEHFWSAIYDRDLRDVLTLQSDVAQAISEKVQVTVNGKEHERLVAARQVSPDAYQAYLKGRYYWNKRTGDGMQKAEQHFQQAIDSDPTYAAAYSGLADCNSGLAWHGFESPAESLPKAYAAARKAIEIDPESAEAHASLGLVLSHRWDWVDAEAEFRRALELDPRYANAHHWYGDYLSIKGRHEEALAEASRALERDPLNLMISTWVGLRYYLAHNYSGAIEQNRNTVQLDSNFAAAHLLLGEDYNQAGFQSEALTELTKAASLSGGSPLYTAQVAVAFAAAGRKRDALRIAHELETTATKRYVSPYGFSQIYATLDDKENTFKWLLTAYDDRAVWMAYLAVDPIFDRYRSDQRFKDLLRRIDLP